MDEHVRLLSQSSSRNVVIKNVVGIHSSTAFDLANYSGVVCDEFLDLCRKAEPSIFQKCHPDTYLTFKWDDYLLELETKAPVFLQFCRAIVEHGGHRNERKKKGRVHLPAICMTVAVLLNERNREMVGLQTCISLLLYASNAQKQVSAIAACG